MYFLRSWQLSVKLFLNIGICIIIMVNYILGGIFWVNLKS